MKQRLIDANELKEEFKLKEVGHYYSSEQYLDYVLNEWKTRPVEHGGYDPVNVVNEAPTIEAIPIEWLKNNLIPRAEQLGATEYANNIRFVLEDWEAWKKYR